MKKIETLTPEQEAAISEYHSKYFAYGCSTEPVDKKKAVKAINAAYKTIGKDPVPIVFVASPLSANVLLAVLQQQETGDSLGESLWDSLWDSLGDSLRGSLWGSLRDTKIKYEYTYWCGQMDLYWIVFYSYCEEILKIKYAIESSNKLTIMRNIGQSCGWWYPKDGLCIVSDRFESVHWDNNTSLHNEHGPSISFRDGWKIYHWHGTIIPEEWIEKTPPAPHKLLKWKNIEQRRAGCEIIGWKKILDILNARIIHQDKDPQIGTLLEADIPDSGVERFLKVRCGTGRDFILPVPRDVQTARQANAWTYGLEENQLKLEGRT